MDANEVRGKDGKALHEELLALRKEQFNLAMQQASGQMPRGHQIRNVRKNIARVKTIMAERVRAVKK
ncbi:MAG: 50S ribosomal protein L29 [Gammaproteobacteria bacterium]